MPPPLTTRSPRVPQIVRTPRRVWAQTPAALALVAVRRVGSASPRVSTRAPTMATPRGTPPTLRASPRAPQPCGGLRVAPKQPACRSRRRGAKVRRTLDGAHAVASPRALAAPPPRNVSAVAHVPRRTRSRLSEAVGVPLPITSEPAVRLTSGSPCSTQRVKTAINS